ncbi:MAG: hypothetical protein AAF518_10975 [Spirochaetota bacterium]
MLTFFSIVFTLIFIALVLHLMYSVDEKKGDKKKQALARQAEELRSQTVDPQKVFGRKWDEGVPRPRICPCCGTPLQKHEYLYASMVQLDADNPKKSVHIYGCRYCYLGMEKESSPEKTKQNQEDPTESLDF